MRKSVEITVTVDDTKSNEILNSASVAMPLGPEKSNVKCQFCKQDITTRISAKNTAYTHYIAMALCLFFFPLVWVPYYFNVYNIVDHYCPECNKMVGTYAT